MDALRTERRGMALPMVLAAIVIIGGLIAGVMYAATQDFRVGANTLNQTRAAAVAEMGLNRVTLNWNLTNNTRMQVGDTTRMSYTDATGATANVFITKLSGPFFWAVSEGQTSGNGVQNGARRRFGTLLRLDTPDIPFMAALTGRGNITVGGSAIVDGTDKNPTGWSSCGSTGKALAGLAMSDTTSGLKLPGCDVAKSCVNGSPKFLQTLAAADTATYFVYGNSSYAALAATASKVLGSGTYTGLGPVVSAGVCDVANNNNWGDPLRAISPVPAGACESYFPVIRVTGDVRLSGGRGQGILLVDGDLEISGGFEFVGVVIVRGYLRSTGTGGHITGGVMAANVDLDADNTVLGNSKIQYSSCALQATMNGSSYPKSAKQRAWVNLY